MNHQFCYLFLILFIHFNLKVVIPIYVHIICLFRFLNEDSLSEKIHTVKIWICMIDEGTYIFMYKQEGNAADV